jgi:choline dehydrogenase-like flavoprotein
MCRASSTAIFGHVSERYDVIIVGSGAGGGTLAHTLAPSGKRILLLERGNFLGKSNAMAMKGEEPKLTKLAPKWSLEEVARHAADFWLTTEDVPKPDNRVTIC